MKLLVSRFETVGRSIFVLLVLFLGKTSFAVTENISYQNQVKVLFDGSVIKKSVSCESCYDSGALSNQKITSGPGYVEFVFNRYTASLPAFTVVGLGPYNSRTSYNDARYNLRFNSGYVSAYLGDAWKCDTSASGLGTVFRISVANNVVSFSKNGTQFCSFSDSVSYPLYFDVMFATSWTNIQNAKMNYSVAQASLVTASMSVGAGTTFSFSETRTRVTVNVSGGTPANVKLSRDGYAPFYTWTSPTSTSGSTLSYGMDWCISSSCFGGVTGTHVLYADYTMPDGSTGRKSYAMNVTASAGVSLSANSTSLGVVNFNGSSGVNNGSYNYYANPPVGRGGYFNDPAFGTKILRATDGTLGGYPGCFHIYSYWSAFNINNTKIIINCNGVTRAYGFDPANFRMTGQVWDLAPAGTYSSSDGFDWSNDPNYPNRVYFFNNKQILYNDVGSGNPPVVIRDFSSLLGDQVLCQVSKSRNDDTFAFHRVLSGYSCSKPSSGGRGYVVYRRSNNTIYVNTCHPWTGSYCDINEVHINKTGDYLSISTDNHVKGLISGIMNIYNVNSMTYLYQNDVDKPEGHYDLLNGWLVGVENSFDNAMHMRNLANPKSFYAIGPKGGWGSNIHVSGNADNERWVLVSSYGFGDSWVGNTYQSDGISDSKQIFLPFQNEIWQLATDGSGKVRRIAHHMSESTFYDAYRGMPKANISRNGQFVIYSSAWGGRMDVYIAQIPPAP